MDRLCLVAVGLVAAGFVDFPLIVYHLQKQSVVPPVWIPAFYATTMAAVALAAPVFGRIYDRLELSTLAVASSRPRSRCYLRRCLF